MNIKSCEACELTLNIEISRRKLGSHEFSPRLQLQLLVVGKTSGTSLPLGEQRAPDYRGYRSPSLSASVLLAGSPSIRSPRGGGASPLDASHPSPQPQPPPKPPKPPFQSTEANYISASVEFAQSSSLEWRSIRAWVDFVFWW